MGRSSNKRYRSYREKKSQTKRFRIYFIRVLIMFVFYSILTVFVAISIKVDSNSMSPNINKGNSIVMQPTKNLNSLFGQKNNKIYKRGDIVLTGTTYIVEPTFIEMILDPIVRIFTLQKKSLIYDNTNNKGRAEILRVVGIPGDILKIKDSTVYVKPNGEDFFLSEFELTKIDYDITKTELANKWKNEYPFSTELNEQIIKEGSYFLISDNRYTNNDSRVFGLINQNEIKGRVILKYWPIDEFKFY